MTEVATRRLSQARTQKYAAERKALIEAGYRCLSRPPERGFVLDVLRDTGLSTRAFYRHFSTRDELLVAMFRVEAERANRRLRQASDREPTPAEGLCAFASEYLMAAYAPRRALRSRVLASPEAHSSRILREETARDAVTKRAITLEVFQALGSPAPEADAYAFIALLSRYVEDRLLGRAEVPFETALSHTVGLFLPGHGGRTLCGPA